jgi:hypothetical protein
MEEMGSALEQAAMVCFFLAKQIHVAKLYYFDTDPDKSFRKMRKSSL